MYYGGIRVNYGNITQGELVAFINYMLPKCFYYYGAW